ncbi:MAG: alpha/beta fold hydrolase [Gemmatimonadota bacterium]
MTEVHSPSPVYDAPKPSAAEIRALVAAQLGRASGPWHVALLLFALSATGLVIALLMTEPALPPRAKTAFAVMIAIGASWSAFAAWVLLRRGLLFGKDQMVAARLAVSFATLFTFGASTAAKWSPTGRPWYGAMAFGLAMMAFAVARLIRARRRFDKLSKRRAVLEQQLAAGAKSGAVVLLLLALLGGASAAQQSPPNPDIVLSAGTFRVGEQSIPVTDGRLTVPANRASASDAQLTLAFVRIKSTAAEPGAPIVFLAGGPGDAGTRMVSGMPKSLLDQLLAIADVIAFDQRGTGLSQPLNAYCAPGEAVPLDRPADPKAMAIALRAQVDACLANARRTGVDVMGLTTVESADDLEALRRALAVEKLSLLAGSYGTHLALAMARRHPASIDRMMLVGVEGPDDTFKLPSRVDDVLGEIGKVIRPTLVEEVRSLHALMSAGPVRYTFPTGQVIVLGGWDLQRWVSESMDEAPKIKAMTAAVSLMLAGDFTSLAQWAVVYRRARPLQLMHLAMDCASYASSERLQRIAREAQKSVLGDAINFPLPGVCDVPGLPRLSDSYRESVTSPVSALLVAGTWDGRTPVQNAIDVGRTLSRSRMLIVNRASHALFREPEVNAALLEFFKK